MDSKKNVLTVREVKNTIEEIVPVQLQEEWDNSGLLIGFENQSVEKILLCLEMNEKVLSEALEIGADMIITHHPLIFGGLKSLSADKIKDKIIMDCIKNSISVYSCHTPFDKVKGGNNDFIAEKLGLTGIRNLKGDDIASPAKMCERNDEADIGRIGGVKQIITLGQAIQLVASQLDMSLRQIRAVGSMDAKISTIGICTGAGADLLRMGAASGCQLFITGDVKYHEAQDAEEMGICLIDAGHHGTEKFFPEAMKAKLEKKFDDNIELIISGVDLDPFKIL